MVKCDIAKYRLENWKIRYNFLYVNSESGVVIFTNSASFALCLPQLKAFGKRSDSIQVISFSKAASLIM